MKAIPTEYNGQQYRSRFEAEVAQTLTTFPIRFEYEPKSFLLPDGLHYWPDFWIPDAKMFVECRGYRNEHGDQQLRVFVEHLEAQNDGTSFLLVAPPCRWRLLRLAAQSLEHGEWIIGVLAALEE